MQIKDVCQSCGELMEVHEHTSWLEVKACTRTLPALCPACASWPGMPCAAEVQRLSAGGVQCRRADRDH
jgi:hypothetical protein